MLGVISRRELEVLAILYRRGYKRFQPFKRGHGKMNHVLRGGGGVAQQIWTPNFPIL